MAFFSGYAGVIYRQFAVTVFAAMALWVAIALIFTSALCATLLKPHDATVAPRRRLPPGVWFNRQFDRARALYDRAVDVILRRVWLALAAFLGLAAVLVLLFLRLPGGFLPDEDQGIIFAKIIMPPGTSAEATAGVADRVVTAPSLAEAESSVRTTEASLAQCRRKAAQDENALHLLLGASLPPALQAALDRQDSLEGRPPFPQAAAGLPSDLILRRPDIRSAGHTLLSANASIGAARANFFPQLTVTASGAAVGNDLSNLFRARQGNWSFAPSVSLPILDWGVADAKLDYARSQKRSEVASYGKAVQTGFREVCDALAAQSTYREQPDAERKLVAADQRNYDLSLTRFHAGTDTYVSTLVAQRSLFSAQLDLISNHSSQLKSQTTLFKVLGGGWQNAFAFAGPGWTHAAGCCLVRAVVNLDHHAAL